MFEHIILFSSSYRTGRRIGWHYSSKIIHREELEEIMKKTIEIIGETKYAVHRLTTISSSWQSVIDRDSFFEDIYVYEKLEDFLLEMKKDAKITALDVAKFLLAIQKMSNLKLQKMLYLVYADYLLKNGKKLFSEKIIAYPYGPVIEEVYYHYKENSSSLIDDDTYLIKQSVTLPIALARFLQADNEKNILKSIQDTFEKYGNLSARELVMITHRSGSPWSNTKLKDVIKDDDIIKYHKVEEI